MLSAPTVMGRAATLTRLLLHIVMHETMSARMTLPGATGILLCKDKCGGISGCDSVIFFWELLRCDVFPGQAHHLQMSDGKRFNVTAMANACSGKCPVKSRGIATRRGLCACVTPGTAVYTVTRNGSATITMARPRAEFQKYKHSSRIRGVIGSRRPHSSQKVLTVSLTNTSTPVQPTTAMYALNLESYKWETIGQFDGAVVSVDYSDNVLYRCQKHPSGLYKTILKAGKFDMISERRLFSGPCFDVAGFPHISTVLFFKNKALWRYDEEVDAMMKFPFSVDGKESDERIVADKKNLVFYLYSRVRNIVMKMDLNGTQLLTFRIPAPISEMVILQRPTKNTFWYIYMNDMKTMTGGSLRRGLQAFKRFKWKTITAFALTRFKILLAHKRSIKIWDLRTLRSQVSVKSFDSEMSQPFSNLNFLDA